MRKIFLPIFILISVVVHCQSNNSYGIENEIWTLFQNNSNFFKKVYIQVPQECSRDLYSDLINQVEAKTGAFGIPEVKSYIGQNSIDNNMKNRNLIPFLVSEGLAEIKSAVQIDSKNTSCLDFLFYTNKGKSLIRNYKVDGLADYSFPKLNIGNRKILNVLYRNKYEDITLKDGKRWYYIFRYSYVIENNFLDNKKNTQTPIEGHFKAVLNPDNGQWQIKEDEVVSGSKDAIIKGAHIAEADEKQEILRLEKAYSSYKYKSNCDSLKNEANANKIKSDALNEAERQLEQDEKNAQKGIELNKQTLFLNIPSGIDGKKMVLKVLPVMNNSNNINAFNYFKSQTVEKFVNILRYRYINVEEFDSTPLESQYELQITFSDFQFRNMSLQPSVVDWQAEAYFRYELKKGGELNRQENLVYKGGDPIFTDTKETAQTGLTIALNKWNYIIAYLCFNTQCNIVSIEEEDKKRVKLVALDNADYIDTKAPIGFIFYKTGTTILQGQNNLNAADALAKGELKKNEFGKTICKITGGGDRLKELLAAGEKVIAISTIERLSSQIKILNN